MNKKECNLPINSFLCKICKLCNIDETMAKKGGKKSGKGGKKC
jgi:hypothetical protein